MMSSSLETLASICLELLPGYQSEQTMDSYHLTVMYVATTYKSVICLVECVASDKNTIILVMHGNGARGVTWGHMSSYKLNQGLLPGMWRISSSLSPRLNTCPSSRHVTWAGWAQ